MALNKGDMASFDYSLFVEGHLNETSEKAKAVEAGILRASKRYEPILFTVGRGQLVPGLEDAIVANGAVGVTQRTVVVKPFGERNRDLIKTVPKQKFGAQQPQIGMRVTLDNREGIVTRVGGGRVTVDCHHELAGKDVEYEYTVLSIVTEPPRKVEAILTQALGKDVEYHWDDSEHTDYSNLVVVTPASVLVNRDWAMGRVGLVSALRTAMGKPFTVSFTERFPPPPAVPTPPATAVPPTQEAVDPTL